MLITVQYLKDFFSEQISDHIDDKIERAIKEAEKFDIKELLGKAFYYDLENNQELDKYVDILDGTSYQDRNGNTISFDGLKTCLAYFAFARIVDHPNGIIVARFGTVRKLSDLSEPIDAKNLARSSAQLKDIARSYFQEVEDFLNEKQDIYELWKSSCSKQDVSTEYSPITKIKFRKYPKKP